MDFFGIGLPELVVILALALIVVGPKRLPETAAQIARAIRELRRYSAGMTREISDMVKDIEQEYEGLKGELKEAGTEMRQRVAAVTGEIAGTAEEARKQLQQVAGPEEKGEKTPDAVAGDSVAAPPEPPIQEER